MAKTKKLIDIDIEAIIKKLDGLNGIATAGILDGAKCTGGLSVLVPEKLRNWRWAG